MATLTINGRHVTDVEGLSLFDAAARVGVRVPTSCVTLGKCKECVVEVTRGADLLSPPTEAERHLSAAAPFRLSCQARIAGRGGTIECHTMRRGQMRIERGGRELPSASGIPFDPGVTREGDRILIDGREIDRRAGPIYGLAMDIGTTTIVLRLIDLDTGALVGDSSFENPQRFGGSDVMSRIHYDTTHPGKLLRRTLAGYLTHAIEEFPIDPRAIYEAVVVGNSTMRDIFFRQNVYSIGQNPYRSITEIEMAEGKRATTSLVETGRRSLLPYSSAGACVRVAGDQRARGRGCGGVHAGGRSGARRPRGGDHGHRHQHRTRGRQSHARARGLVSRGAGVRGWRNHLRHARSGRRGGGRGDPRRWDDGAACDWRRPTRGHLRIGSRRSAERTHAHRPHERDGPLR
jgi:ferredoxin